MGRSRYHFASAELPHFMTCSVLQWISIFKNPDTIDILLNSLRFLQGDGLKIYAFVILEDHLHIIAQSSNLSRDIARFKSITAKQILAWLSEHEEYTLLSKFSLNKKAHKRDRKFQFWQEGVHPEWIQNKKMMIQKIEYIHNNPVEYGYVKRPEDWRYSSARNYLDLDSVLEVCKEW